MRTQILFFSLPEIRVFSTVVGKNEKMTGSQAGNEMNEKRKDRR